MSNLIAIIERIDAELGVGFSRAHPELAAAFVIADALNGISVMIETNGAVLSDIVRVIGEADYQDNVTRKRKRTSV